MRTIALFAFLALAPGLATAQANGLTATGSSVGIGAEFSRLDTDYAGGKGRLAGGNIHLQTGSFLRLEGRVLTGELESGSTEERANLVEGEATIGFAASSHTRLYIGGGYRLLDSAPNPDAQRLSHTIYAPIGVASHGRISERWTAITTISYGLVVRGIEDINDPTIGVDATFTRNSGSVLQGSIEFGRTYEVGTLSIEPYFRRFSLGATDPVDGTSISGIDVKETGLRFNYQL